MPSQFMSDRQFQSFLYDDDCGALLEEYPFYPLNSPGVPLPGADFIAEAQRLGDSAPDTVGKGSSARLVSSGKYLDYLYLRALYDPNFSIPVTVKGLAMPADFVAGHLWGAVEGDEGPRESSVMIIGKIAPSEFSASGNTNLGKRFLAGNAATLLEQRLVAAGIPEEDYIGWYVTALVKHRNLNASGGAVPQAWIRNCAPILAQELRLVRPDYILCLGTESSKYLLGPKGGVEQMRGRVAEYTFAYHELDEEPKYHTAKVVTVINPAAVLRTPERQDELDIGIQRFGGLTRGEPVDATEHDIDHRIVYKHRELKKIVDEILDTEDEEIVLAVDAEWHGETPWSPGSYLRSVQFSHKAKFACCVVLNNQGGTPAFVPTQQSAIDELRRLFDPAINGKKIRVGGHFFRSDIPWIHKKLGIDLREVYKPLRDGGSGSEVKGGFDTALMCHAVDEAARFKLEDIAVRYTECPRWDVGLQTWKKDYCSEHKLKDKDLEGYGECPDDVLYPYAAYDADATRRLFDVFDALMVEDRFGNNCRDAYWLSHSASLCVLEMERSGLGVDMNRAELLIDAFTEAQTDLLAQLREEIAWPDFNPGSAPQCRALLFGDEHGKKVSGASYINVRPDDAVTLDLDPITSTGQRPRAWVDLVRTGTAHRHTPSTNGETLGILGQQHPIAAKVRDIRFLGQVLKTVLRPKDEIEEGGESKYSTGLLSYVEGDGRIRTNLMQTMETGRFSSSRPNLQNISKRREDDYKRILGDSYLYPIRTIFTAKPGHVFVEADYTGAELAGIMWMAQDAAGIEHVRRNMLPEDHEDYFDMHSQAAVSAFNLKCEPTKRGLKDAGVPGLRVAAKNVKFGIPYGRGAAAIARQCREEGVDLTEDEAQVLVDDYFDTYPETRAFLAQCRARVHEPSWVCSAFGRYRRFPQTSEKSVIAEQERQAQNFPIQSLVADAMNLAIANLYNYREQHPSVLYDIVLQIHDAVLLEIPVEHIAEVCDTVLPYCMSEMVPVVPADLSGEPLRAADGSLLTYQLASDRDISVNWGISLTDEQAESLGIPSRLL
jgi:uracil-DNA glycosylase family 4